MSVNGIEIKVKQAWRRRDGRIVTIARTDGDFKTCRAEYPVVADDGNVYKTTGEWQHGGAHPYDLVELIVEAPAPIAAAPTATLPPPASAPALLGAAAGHMRDRAATYDKPEGERSMAQTVALFNQYHGTALTEAQGWHFMQILKDVRLFANPSKPHRDSIEDGVAYCALKGEAMLKGNK